MNVLVVDDSESNRLVTLLMLEHLGQQAEAAVNGAQAVEACCRKPFDLVLMDCQMPVMDGWEATRRIRAVERTGGGHLPIIAMTANDLPEERVKCLAAGMDGFVSKPLQQAGLEELLGLWSGREMPKAAPAPAPTLDLRRIDELRKLSDQHAPGLFDQLTEGFNTDVPERIGELRKALAAGDRDAFHAAAHSLAGISGNIGAARLMGVARELQAWGRTVPLAGAAAIISRLEVEFARARAQLHGTYSSTRWPES